MNTSLTTRRRTLLIFVFLAAAVLALVVRVGYLQLVRGAELQKEALETRQHRVPIDAKRGTIYDRNGEELAVSISADSVIAFPPEVKGSGKAREIAAQLADILGDSPQTIYENITRDTYFWYVKRRVDFEQGAQIKELKLPGIEVVEESSRYYPKGSLAAHVLGLAGVDNQGLEGVEYFYEQELAGAQGSLLIEFDAMGRQIPTAVHRYEPPADGKNLVLTIDQGIQYVAERELDQLIQSPTNPKSASIIVMDPNTGDILALANRPTYNPNDFLADPNRKYTEAFRNVAVTDSYEPGSTFKVVTTSAALEEGVVTPEDRFYDPGYIMVGKERIRCWRSYNPHGSQSFVEGVQNSCNPVFVEVGLRLEEKEKGLFYKYIRGFGFGRPTGIDTSGEAKGQMIPEEKLKQIDIATISIGQSIAVTPLQMVQAMSAAVNGGKLVQPRLVKEIRDHQNRLLEEINPRVVRQVISPETSLAVREILESVVASGTGSNAYIEGYRVGGKTGTAQKAGPGGYQAGKYVSSFLGFAPANDPKVVALVVINEPQGVYYGGQIAAPIFKRVVEDSLRYLGVPAQLSAAEYEALENLVLVPDVVGQPADAARGAIKSAGLDPAEQGEGSVVVRQVPEAAARVKPGTRVLLYLGPEQFAGEDVVVPDLTGFRLPQATEMLDALGLVLSPKGSGTVREQTPVPGTRVSRGSTVEAEFAEEIPSVVTGP